MNSNFTHKEEDGWLKKSACFVVKFALIFHQDCFCLNVDKEKKIYTTPPSSFVIIIAVVIAIIHFHT